MSKILLDLGRQPLVNNLCKTKEESLAANQYPISAIYEEDLTIHLDKEVPPEKLFSSYYYRSGVNAPYKKHCQDLFNSFKHLKHEVLIDVGGNDGTLLKTFKKLSLQEQESSEHSKRFINVDPSETFQLTNLSEGIEYKKEYFSDKTDIPKANIITSTNVFQHTKDVHAFLRGIVKHLDGVWILEFPYTFNTINTLQFDQFYHEHYYYWLITPIEQLFRQYGLKILHISENIMQGGSIRIWSTNKSPSAPEVLPVINLYKEKEASLMLHKFDYKVREYIKNARGFINNLEGKIAFFGAAAKGSVFLNSLGITSKLLPDSYVVDDTVQKQGLFLPGSGFEVVGRERLSEQPVENLIILTHNFKDHIINSIRSKSTEGINRYSGNIYTMLPKIEKHT